VWTGFAVVFPEGDVVAVTAVGVIDGAFVLEKLLVLRKLNFVGFVVALDALTALGLLSKGLDALLGVLTQDNVLYGRVSDLFLVVLVFLGLAQTVVARTFFS